MNRKLVIALVVVLLLVGCCVCTGVLLVVVNREQASFAPLSAACDGRPVPGSAAYVRGAPPKLAFFERLSAGWSASQSTVFVPQRAAGVSDAALVACAGEPVKRNVVESCCYERTVIGIGVPGSERCLPRVRMSRRISVYVARTGALLTEREILGPVPKTCDDWVGREPSAGNFEGDEPGDAELAAFFRDPEAPEVPAPSTSPAPEIDAGATPPVK